MQPFQFDELQIEVLNKLEFENKISEYKPDLPQLVYSLLSVNSIIGETALGKIGKKLVEFINKVDLDHPDLPFVINELFNNDKLFIQQVIESLELADRCKHLSTLTSSFYKLVDRAKFSKLFVQSNTFGTRLFKSRHEREVIRKQRKTQILDLKNVYKKGNEIWNSKPDNFKIFNRHNIPYVDYIETSERKINRYKELGCQVISDKLIDEIRQLKINISERYYGFNRLTMSTAAIILAKMNGFRLKTSWDALDNKEISIIIPFEAIYDFIPEDSRIPVTFHPRIRGTGYIYEPRAYPIEKLLSTASENVLKVIEHLDNFPDINGKPLFDNLIVLVPTVQLHNYGKYFIKDQKGNILGFDSQEEAALFIDKILIKEKYICPILLGERNSKCYFISYFN